MPKKVVLYTTSSCPYCHAAKEFLTSKNVNYEEIDVSQNEAMREKLAKLSGQMTVPQIFADGKSIGGYEDLVRYYQSGKTLLVLLFLAAFVFLAHPAPAAEKKTYTHKGFLYSIDYPEEWRVKEISKVTMFLSPLESRQDKFAENVEVGVEDLSRAGEVSLIDYHRKSVDTATVMLKDFKMLEQAKTEFIGREAIAVLYTAVIKEKLFRFKKVTILVGKEAYSLTYNALSDDFEKYLPAAEKIMRSLQV